jgi:hypothetical protein
MYGDTWRRKNPKVVFSQAVNFKPDSFVTKDSAVVKCIRTLLVENIAHDLSWGQNHKAVDVAKAQ